MDELFPSLAGRGLIAIDTETCDPELKTKGPGYFKSNTFIAGISVGTEDGFRRYYPIAHESGGNLPREKVLGWLNEQLSTDTPKVGAKLIYDLGFLESEGVFVKGPLYDVQVAEALLDENRFQYSLETLSQDYLGEGKDDEAMDAYLVQHFGKKNPKGSIWRAPPDIVAPYAMSDVDRPLRIFAKQRPQLTAQGLWGLFILESKLIRMLLKMRQRGVLVDLNKAQQLYDELTIKQEAVLAQIKHISGIDVNVNAGSSLAQVFDALGLTYPRTPKTKAPSFTKEWLAACPEPIAQLILEVRQLDKLRGTFLQGCILGAHYNGRVHTEFNQLKSEEGGTVTGRFSSSNPNLQFIPIRSDLGKVIRSLFIPDEEQDFYSADYSQIEYRLMVHDAASLNLPGAADVVRQYAEDPDVDFHKVIAEMTGLERGPAKTVNFGIAYGEGKDKLCRSLGLDEEEGEALLKEYHRRAPFMRPLSQGASRQAAVEGEIRTLLNRKRRFDSWVITDRKTGKPVILRERVAGSKRAFTHKALNARIQGSAADIMKKAMIDVYESGVMDVLGVPQLTVHDELDGSVPRTNEGKEALHEMTHIMESTVKLLVPLRVDCGVGKNWAEAH